MKSKGDMKSRAFAQGFIQGFSNIGQVYEPIVGGMDVICESKKPVSLEVMARSVKHSPVYKQYLQRRWRKRLLLGDSVARTLVKK